MSTDAEAEAESKAALKSTASASLVKRVENQLVYEEELSVIILKGTTAHH